MSADYIEHYYLAESAFAKAVEVHDAAEAAFSKAVEEARAYDAHLSNAFSKALEEHAAAETAFESACNTYFVARATYIAVSDAAAVFAVASERMSAIRTINTAR